MPVCMTVLGHASPVSGAELLKICKDAVIRFDAGCASTRILLCIIPVEGFLLQTRARYGVEGMPPVESNVK